MTDFIHALSNPDIPFLRFALIAGLLSSISFGVIGTYVVVRRISYLAGAIAHCILGGIGAALFLQHHFKLAWCTPLLGAIVAALLAALILELVNRYANQREDTLIGALWSIGMSVGLIFIAYTPGYIDPMSYLFGNILIITQSDLWLIAGLDIIVAGLSIYFYNTFLAICHDEEFLALRGVRVGLYSLLMLCLTALAIVLLVRIVGIVLVIALLTLPPAIASHTTRHLWQMILVSIAACACFTTIGLGISYELNLPSGPVIILTAGIAYLGTLILKQIIHSVSHPNT